MLNQFNLIVDAIELKTESLSYTTPILTCRLSSLKIRLTDEWEKASKTSKNQEYKFFFLLQFVFF